MPFDPSLLQPNPEERQILVEILSAALAAVNPKEALLRALQVEGDRLQAGDLSYDLSRYQQIYVVGAGKAGAPMAQAVERLLHPRTGTGVVVVKEGHGGPAQWVQIREAGHPMPDQAGVAGGREVLDLVNQAGPQDLVIALLSGGGSALLVAPAEGLSLADLQALTDALLACGATIDEINCLRKHCSGVKGGQLAQAAAPAQLLTLVLSDVVGSPLDVIASGPTVPDSSTWADAGAVVEKYGLAEALPRAIVQRLQAGLAGELSDTPKPGDALFEASQTLVIGDNRVAALAAQEKATELGFNTLLLTTFLQGEAREMAKAAVALGREVQSSGHPVAAPACLILGGETTVQLGPNPGRGGRNQELALAAALAVAEHPGITVISLATDGTDGPTDSAGGLADSGTLGRGRQAGLDARRHLREHNAYPYLQATQDLLRTGPTQTNVNDLIFVVVT